MGATERRQDTAGLEQLQRANVEFLVAAQRVGDGGAIAREGRRVEHDEVKLGQQLFVRAGPGLRFEPIKNIDGFGGNNPSISDFGRI